jgi:hypothetical protein
MQGWPSGSGSALRFATSEALGDVGSSDVAVVVPKYRVFMNAGHAPTTIRDRSRDPRIPRAGLGSSRGSDQLCADHGARRRFDGAEGDRSDGCGALPALRRSPRAQRLEVPRSRQSGARAAGFRCSRRPLPHRPEESAVSPRAATPMLVARRSRWITFRQSVAFVGEALVRRGARRSVLSRAVGVVTQGRVGLEIADAALLRESADRACRT